MRVCKPNLLQHLQSNIHGHLRSRDAAFHEESEAGAWVFVARNEQGTFLVAAASKMQHVRSLLLAEMIACMKEIEGAFDLGAQCIVF